MNARLGCAVVGVLVVCLCGEAVGQDGVDYEAAKRHYKNGEEAAAKAEWSTAAKEYGIAYEITKDPVLFYKMATAYGAAGDCESALIYYARYMKEAKPEQRFKDRAQEKVNACKDKLKGGTGSASGTASSSGSAAAATESGSGTGAVGSVADPEVPPGGEPPPNFDDNDGKPTWQRTAGWASVGAVVTFATIGAVFGLSAQSREEDIENLFMTAGEPETYEGAVKARYEDLVDEGERLEILSYAAFGVAGAATVAAILFFVMDHGSPAEAGETAIAPAIGPHQVGLSAQWRF